MKLTLAERQLRVVLPLAWPLALLGAPAVLSLGDIPLCGFRALTGVPCPLCGGTRACAALAAGNLGAAWAANPGLFPLFVLAAVQALFWSIEAWSGSRLQRWRIAPQLWAAAFLFLLVQWLVRLATAL